MHTLLLRSWRLLPGLERHRVSLCLFTFSDCSHRAGTKSNITCSIHDLVYIYYGAPVYSSRPLQLGEDRVGARDGDATSGLQLGVGDLAVVDDNGVAAGAGGSGQPSNALAELAVLVRGKDL